MRVLLIAQQLDHLARGMVPAASVACLILPALLPLGAPWLSEAMPHFSMMAVFYWALYRPDLLPAAAVFCTGLVQDILSGSPVGLNALTLLAVLAVTQSQRQAIVFRPFPIAWGGFALIAAGAFLAMWLLTSLLALRPVLAPAALLQCITTVLVFPVMAWALVRMHRYLVR